MNEIKENVINKNFMITYDFSDNDFGGDIECAIETWVDKWNSIVSNIKRYGDSNSELMVKHFVICFDNTSILLEGLHY